MAVRIRKDGRVLCAAMHQAEDGDTYINDGLHYRLSVEEKVLVTEPHERHSQHGEWWWAGSIPAGITVDPFYLTEHPSGSLAKGGLPSNDTASVVY